MDQGGDRLDDDAFDEEQDGDQGWYFDLPSGAWERQVEKNRSLREQLLRAEKEADGPRDPFTGQRKSKRRLLPFGKKKDDEQQGEDTSRPRFQYRTTDDERVSRFRALSESEDAEPTDEWSTEPGPSTPAPEEDAGDRPLLRHRESDTFSESGTASSSDSRWDQLFGAPAGDAGLLEGMRSWARGDEAPPPIDLSDEPEQDDVPDLLQRRREEPQENAAPEAAPGTKGDHEDTEVPDLLGRRHAEEGDSSIEKEPSLEDEDALAAMRAWAEASREEEQHQEHRWLAPGPIETEPVEQPEASESTGDDAPVASSWEDALAAPIDGGLEAMRAWAEQPATDVEAEHRRVLPIEPLQEEELQAAEPDGSAERDSNEDNGERESANETPKRGLLKRLFGIGKPREDAAEDPAELIQEPDGNEFEELVARSGGTGAFDPYGESGWGSRPGASRRLAESTVDGSEWVPVDEGEAMSRAEEDVETAQYELPREDQGPADEAHATEGGFADAAAMANVPANTPVEEATKEPPALGWFIDERAQDDDVIAARAEREAAVEAAAMARADAPAPADDDMSTGFRFEREPAPSEPMTGGAAEQRPGAGDDPLAVGWFVETDANEDARLASTEHAPFAPAYEEHTSPAEVAETEGEAEPRKPGFLRRLFGLGGSPDKDETVDEPVSEAAEDGTEDELDRLAAALPDLTDTGAEPLDEDANHAAESPWAALRDSEAEDESPWTPVSEPVQGMKSADDEAGEREEDAPGWAVAAMAEGAEMLDDGDDSEDDTASPWAALTESRDTSASPWSPPASESVQDADDEAGETEENSLSWAMAAMAEEVEMLDDGSGEDDTASPWAALTASSDENESPWSPPVAESVMDVQSADDGAGETEESALSSAMAAMAEEAEMLDDGEEDAEDGGASPWAALTASSDETVSPWSPPVAESVMDVQSADDGAGETEENALSWAMAAMAEEAEMLDDGEEDAADDEASPWAALTASSDENVSPWSPPVAESVQEGQSADDDVDDAASPWAMVPADDEDEESEWAPELDEEDVPPMQGRLEGGVEHIDASSGEEAGEWSPEPDDEGPIALPAGTQMSLEMSSTPQEAGDEASRAEASADSADDAPDWSMFTFGEGDDEPDESATVPAATEEGPDWSFFRFGEEDADEATPGAGDTASADAAEDDAQASAEPGDDSAAAWWEQPTEPEDVPGLIDEDRAFREQKGAGGLLSRAAASLWDDDADGEGGDETPSEPEDRGGEPDLWAAIASEASKSGEDEELHNPGVFGIHGYRQHSTQWDEDDYDADENFVPATTTSDDEADLVLRAFEAHAAADRDDDDDTAIPEEPEPAKPNEFNELLGDDSEEIVEDAKASTAGGVSFARMHWGNSGEQPPRREEEEEQGWTLSPAGGGGHGGGSNDAAAISFGEPDDYFAAREARKHKTRTLVRELVETGLLALLVFLAVRASFQNFKVDGSSMYPTLEDGQFLIVNKLVYSEIDMERLGEFVPFVEAGDEPTRHVFHGAERGDIIVLRDPGNPDVDLIKRVVGLPGDKLEIVDGAVYINDFLLEEPYIQGEWSDDHPAVRIPEDHYFVMGDNRDNSKDSRSSAIGFIDEDLIIGRAELRYLPLDAFGLAPNGDPIVSDEERPVVTTQQLDEDEQ